MYMLQWVFFAISNFFPLRPLGPQPPMPIGFLSFLGPTFESIQVNLCKKLFFLQNMGRTGCVQKLFWMSKTISVHNEFSLRTWGEHVVYRNCFWHSTRRASDKDLPVCRLFSVCTLYLLSHTFQRFREFYHLCCASLLAQIFTKTDEAILSLNHLF